MNPLVTNSSPPPPAAANDLLARRKRGRPRKDETSFVITKPEADLVGKEVSGVVEGSFDAGYFLNVEVNGSDEKLRGLAFIPGKVTQITRENDVAPHVEMVRRGENSIQADQAITSSDQPMTTDLENSDSARGFSLMPEAKNGEEVTGRDGVMVEEAATRLVEYFPTPETVNAQPNLVETEPHKSIGETTRGSDPMVAEKPVCVGEKVPEMLHLELGNGNNNVVTMETYADNSVSKTGFIANLFEGQEKKKDEEATPSVQ